MVSSRLALTTDKDHTAAPEQWCDIPGWEGFYQASTHGRIQSLDRTVETNRGPRKVRGRVLSPTREEQKKGHYHVTLSRDGACATHYVHHLVALAFHGPRPEGKWALHEDGDETNNAPRNLYYGTPSENSYDAVRHGTHPQASRTHCTWGHLLAGSNITLASSADPHHRACRSCNRAGAVGQRQGFHRGDPRFKATADAIFAQLAKADEALYPATVPEIEAA